MPFQIILMVHVALAVFLITIILLQHGKGADVGATFGGGGGSLFGAAGADNLLTKVTAMSAGGFMITSILLAVAQKPSLLNSSTLTEGLPSKVQSTAQGVSANTAAGAASTGIPDVQVVPAPSSAPAKNEAQQKTGSNVKVVTPEAKEFEPITKTNSVTTSKKAATDVKVSPNQTSQSPTASTKAEIGTTQTINAAAQKLQNKVQESSAVVDKNVAEKTLNSVSPAASSAANTIKEAVVEKVIPNSPAPE